MHYRFHPSFLLSSVTPSRRAVSYARRPLVASLVLVSAAAGCSAGVEPPRSSEPTGKTTSALTSASWDTALTDAVAFTDPSLIVQAPGQKLDVLYGGESTSVRRRRFDASIGWTGEVDLAGYLIGKPSGISWSAFGNGDTDDVRIFARGGDSTLWQISRKGSSLGWDFIGGTMASAPSVASWGPGRIDVFYLGPDAALRHRAFEGAWAGEENLGGQLVGDPASVARGGRVDTVVRAAAGGIAHSWWDGRWNWETLAGGDLGSDPAIASWGAGRLDLFYRGTTGALKHRFTTHYTDWSQEQDLGGVIKGTPAAASWGPGHVDVVARDLSGHIVRRSWDGLAATTEPTAACAPRGWSSDGTCAGPWRFSRYDAPCDVTTSVTDWSCWHQTGTNASPPPVVVTITPARHPHSECNDSGKCKQVIDYDYVAPCNAAAEAQRVAVNATAASGAATEQPRNNCTITLKNVPIFVNGIDDKICPTLPPGQRTAVVHTEVTKVPMEKCSVLAQPFYSAPGLSLPALVQAESTIVQAGGAAPVCLTDDTTNAGAAPADKLDRLYATLRTVSTRVAGGSSIATHDTRGGYVDNVALESSLVDRILLLGETYGDMLRADQRTLVLSLAQSFPELANTCAASFTAPSRDGSCAPTPALDGQLAYCARLLSPAVPTRVAEAFLDDCIAGASVLAAAYPASATACAAPAYRDLERTGARELLGKALTDPPSSDASARSASLNHRLRAMGTWFDLHRPASGAPPSADQLADSSTVMSALWKGVHARAFGSVEAIARDSSARPEDIGAAVASLQASDFEVEREVLMAAYSGSDAAPALADELLLDVTGDALRPMVEQLRAATKFHDFACRLDTCAPTDARNTMSELESVWTLLAMMPNAKSLADASKAAPAGVWTPVFAAIASHHMALEHAAVASTASPYDDQALLAAGDGTIDRGGLAAIVREAVTRTAVFARTGLFDPAGVGALRTGLQREKRDEVIKLVDGRTGAASTALASVQRQRAEAVTALVNHLQGEHDLDALRNRALAKKSDFDLLTANLGALRMGVEGDRRSAADFAASFDAEAKKASATAFAITRGEQRLSVPASGASGAPRAQNWSDIRIVATPWKLAAEPGEIVNLDVSNTWSPICAFQTSHGPDGQPIDATGAITGSEGFIGRLENNHYKATQYSSFSSSDHSQTSTSTQCSGMAVREGVSYAGLDVTPEISASDTQCETSEDGTRYGTSTTRNEGSEHRESSSFAVGIHLADTPFPTAPAGALLAVTMPRDVTARSAVLDVRVVSPHTSMVLGVASDVYLVVNDAQCPLDTGSLTVQVTQLTPAGDLAKKLGAAMAATLADIRALEPRVRAEGRMLPEDTAARRQAAVARLDAALPAGTFTNFPAFQSLYYSWLDGELALLRRSVEIDALEHQRHLDVLELATIADDVKRGQKSSRYLALSARWAIENVDASLLSASADSLREVVGEYLLPLAQIRFPAAITTFAKTKDAPALARLRNASLTTSLAGLVADEITIVSGFSTAVGGAMLDLTTTTSNVRLVGIAIPNPNVASPPKSSLRPVDPATAGEVWKQILENNRFQFTLSPEQIYDGLGGQGVLLCGDSVPVINAMALYVGEYEGGDDPNDPRNTLPTLVPARFDSQMTFPGAAGNATYSFSGDSWLSSNMRVLYGQPVYGVNVLLQQFATSQQQAGLSPFARLDVNLERVATNPAVGLASAPEIDLIYQLDTQSIGATGLHGVGTCH